MAKNSSAPTTKRGAEGTSTAASNKATTKAEREKAAAEKAAAEQADRDKTAAEQADRDKTAAEQADGDKAAAEQTATSTAQEAEPEWARRLSTKFDELAEETRRVRDDLTALQERSPAAAARTDTTTAAVTESEDVDSAATEAAEPTDVGPAANEAAESAFALGQAAAAARARFARALRLDLDPRDELALTQTEQVVASLGFLVKLAEQADRRYRQISDDPDQQQMTHDAFGALVGQTAEAADEVVDEIRAAAGGEHDENERDAFSDLEQVLADDGAVGQPLAQLRSLHEPTEKARRTGRESAAPAGRSGSTYDAGTTHEEARK